MSNRCETPQKEELSMAKILCAGAIVLVAAFLCCCCTLLTLNVYQVSIQGETLGLVEDLDEYIAIVEGVQARQKPSGNVI